MADTKEYLSAYMRFFEEFAATVNPDDQLPVKVAGYYLCDSELVGEIVDWTLQYLNQKHCPSSLLAPLTRIVIEEIKLACKKQPAACGYRLGENTYQPLKLMQVVTGKVNEVCLRYRDYGKLMTLPPPSPGPPISSCAIKNTRRQMEDRHVVIDDFHAVFNVQDRSPTSYYAVFDGHAGTDAAVYSVSHLHQFLAESSFYPTDPERALKDAFSRTDALFLEKSNRENLKSGTTAVCALLRHKEKMLYVAWLGDSQAVLVRQGLALQMVNPHKPDRKDERERIEDMGGCVVYWGTWRVNGQLAVSRAIGDLEYKPFVTAEPDVKAIPLDGTEDFLVLACDGLWDFVSEQDAVEAVYQQIRESPGDLEAVSQRLVQLSKQQGSTDNISVIVVFLTDPVQLASRPVDVWANLNQKQAPSNTMDTSNNPFSSDSVPFQKGGLLLDIGGGGDVYKQNGTSPSANDLYFLDRPSNGKGNFDDDDFGPETDVDAVDDVLLSPTKVTSPRNNNPFEDEEGERKALEADLELQRQQMSDFDPVREPREETPTPPADEVPGVTSVVPESDNVAESGEESEDEWNYYRVEPTAATAETNQQSTQEVCKKSVDPQLEEDDDSMSQLNPDAAEFVPSPTQLMHVDEILLAESPKKGIPMEDISVPSNVEFQNEVSKRPSEMDLTDEPEMFPEQKMAAKLPDLINTEGGDSVNPFLPPGAICGKSVNHLDNGVAFKDFLDQGDRNFQELQNSNIQAKGGVFLDESEVSSTKAEFGDDSAVSFIANELQKTVTETASSFSTMEKSFIEEDILESDFTGDVTNSYENETSDSNKSEQYYKETSNEESFTLEDEMIIKDIGDVNTVPMSFELQKELIPEMESKPELVKLESEGTSSFEQDESSSPVLVEDIKQEGVIDHSLPESAVDDLQAPPSFEEAPVTSKLADFLSDVTNNTSQFQESELSLPDDDKQFQASKPLSPLQSPLHTTFQPPSPMFLQSTPLLVEPPEQVPSSTSPVSPVQQVESSLFTEQEELPSQLAEQLQSSHSPVVSTPPLSPALSKPVQSPPKSPLWEGSPIPGGADTASSTPETVPLGKDAQTPSPAKSPIEDFAPVLDVQSIVPECKPLNEFEVSQFVFDSEKSRQDTTADVSNLRHLEESELILSAQESGESKELQNLLESVDEAPVIKSVEDITVTRTPPPTPATVSEEIFSPQVIKEVEEVAEKSDSLLEKIDTETEKEDLKPEVVEKKNEENEGATTAAAAVVAATVATAVAAGAIMAKEEKKPSTPGTKKPAAATAKKTPVADKTKPTKTTTTTKAGTTATSKISPKPPATSTTKPPATTARTSTPRKPPASTTSPASRVTRSSTTPTATTTKPKAPSTPTGKTSTTTTNTKTSSATKTSVPYPRPKLTNTTTTSKSAVLTNGDATKTAATKKPLSTATTKPISRPATAPAAPKTTTTRTVTSVASRTTTVSAAPRPKPAMNGTTAKPRTTGTVAPATARPKMSAVRDTKQVIDKQVKESANKQISSSRTVTATKSATTTTTKRVTGVTKTSVSATSTLKSVPSKTGVKKAATTTNKTSTKTAVTVTSATENNENLQVQVTASAD